MKRISGVWSNRYDVLEWNRKKQCAFHYPPRRWSRALEIAQVQIVRIKANITSKIDPSVTTSFHYRAAAATATTITRLVARHHLLESQKARVKLTIAECLVNMTLANNVHYGIQQVRA